MALSLDQLLAQPNFAQNYHFNNPQPSNGLLTIHERHWLHNTMSGITFGSIGDIIAVTQIACGLVKALSNGQGSAKEYQGLVKELQTFDQALLQV